MPRLPGIEPKNMFMIVVFAIIGVYLWGIFTTTGTGTCTLSDVEKERHSCTAQGQVYDKIDIVKPEQTKLESSSLFVVKLLLISIAVFLSYITVMRFVGKNPSRRDMATVFILIAAVYLIWAYLIEPTNLFGAANFKELTLNNIGQKTAQMLGIS